MRAYTLIIPASGPYIARPGVVLGPKGKLLGSGVAVAGGSVGQELMFIEVATFDPATLAESEPALSDDRFVLVDMQFEVPLADVLADLQAACKADKNLRPFPRFERDPLYTFVGATKKGAVIIFGAERDQSLATSALFRLDGVDQFLEYTRGEGTLARFASEPRPPEPESQRRLTAADFETLDE